MSMDNPSNPYVTPNVDVRRAPWDSGEPMEYMQSVTFIWDSPNWLVNLLLLAACVVIMNFIPVLPALVVLGYQCEIIEALTLRRNDRYPDFEPNRVMDYLVRGLWPFIVALLGMIVIGLLLVIVLAIPIGLMVFGLNVVGGDEGPVVFAVSVSLIVMLAVGGIIIANMVLLPFMLRAVFTQELGPSFDVPFAKDFLRRVWKEMLLAGLFLLGVALAAQIVGLLLFCVGVLLTLPVVYFSQAHLGAQLYRLYLARGGEKIPLKASPVTATPV